MNAINRHIPNQSNNGRREPIDVIYELFIKPIIDVLKTSYMSEIEYINYEHKNNDTIDIYFEKPNIILNINGREKPEHLAYVIALIPTI